MPVADIGDILPIFEDGESTDSGMEDLVWRVKFSDCGWVDCLEMEDIGHLNKNGNVFLSRLSLLTHHTQELV